MSKQGEPAMDNRSPTIHSLKILVAGFPLSRVLRVDTHTITRVEHGLDHASHNKHYSRFTDRRTTHPLFHQGKKRYARMDAVMAINAEEITKAVVKAILVSAILYAMAAAFFS